MEVYEINCCIIHLVETLKHFSYRCIKQGAVATRQQETRRNNYPGQTFPEEFLKIHPYRVTWNVSAVLRKGDHLFSPHSEF